MRKHKYVNSLNKEVSYIAAYESFLDLFTLLAFTLMFVAFIYIEKTNTNITNASSINLETVSIGSSIGDTVPKNKILLIIFKENSDSWLLFINGTNGKEDKLSINNTNIEIVLNDLYKNFLAVDTVDIVFYEPTQKLDPSIIVNIQRWIVSNSSNKKPNIYFMDK